MVSTPACGEGLSWLAELTPMMRQYQEIKALHPDALLFFHVGDFYELFFDDAIRAAEVLGVTLTSRDGTVPMCGVPVHAAESYLARLAEQGFKVAICDQLEDPRLAKGLVRRAVTRIVTPGTYEGREVEGRMPPLLVALLVEEGKGAVAWLDGHSLRSAVLTGDEAELRRELERLRPQELLLPKPISGAEWVTTIRPDLFAPWPEEPAQRLPEHLPEAARRVVAALWRYAAETTGGGELRLPPPEYVRPGSFLALDAATLAHLEVFRRPDGSRQPTLFAVLDRTVTAAGARLLRSWLLRPLTEPQEIERRLDTVEAFWRAALCRQRTRRLLQEVRDVERALTRLAAGRGGPPECYAVLATLRVLPELAEVLAGGGPALEPYRQRLGDPLTELRRRLEATLRPEEEGHKDGSAVRDGVIPELDEARRLASGARETLLAYEEQIRSESGIRSVKVGYNRVFGYYIEVGKAHSARVPAEWTRRQTLTAAERYTTPFLSELEAKITRAEADRQRLEAEVLAALGEAILARAEPLGHIMGALAEVDVLAGWAELAVERGYVRPTFTPDLRVEIEEGRHPVLETVLPPGRFVPNSLALNTDCRLIILTGPNMAGKSTVLRQTALLQIMAQIGSFVPARAMTTTVLEAIYTRIGAADDLAGGRSTFMVEMHEVARILVGVDRPSLVLLDEVGRGTSTYDGLSLAWAIAEELYRRPNALTLLATHYLELAELPRTLPAARNQSVAVLERGGEVIFLHRLVDRPADRSYGLHVAQLAGIPASVLERAARILAELEAGATARRQVAATHEVLFRFAEPPPDHPVVVALRELTVEELRPVEALVILERLVRQARGEAP